MIAARDATRQAHDRSENWYLVFPDHAPASARAGLGSLDDEYLRRLAGNPEIVVVDHQERQAGISSTILFRLLQLLANP